jgi:diacylglycerol kinase family enzyme
MLLPRLFSGTHVTSPAVHQHRTARVHMTFPQGCPMYVDGEFMDDVVRDLEVRVLPGRLRMF